MWRSARSRQILLSVQQPGVSRHYSLTAKPSFPRPPNEYTQQRRVRLLCNNERTGRALVPSTSSKAAFTTAPSRVQQWLDHQAHKMPSPINLDKILVSSSSSGVQDNNEVDQQLSEMSNSDQELLIDELIHDIPLKGITPEIKNLMTFAMRSQAKIEGKAKVVEGLLMRMIREEDALPKFKVYHGLYGIAIDAWAKQCNMDDVKKSSKAGSAGFAAETTIVPAEQAENIYKLMYTRSQVDPKRARPSLRLLNMVLHGWANSRNLKFAPKRAESLLEWSSDTLGFDPDVYCYTNIIHAYGQQGKALEAERILAELEVRLEKHLTENGEVIDENSHDLVIPNVKTFTSVISAWAKSKQVSVKARTRRAEEVLERLEKWYRRLGRPDLRPNQMTFSTAMRGANQHSANPYPSGNILAVHKRIQEYEGIVPFECSPTNNTTLKDAKVTNAEFLEIVLKDTLRHIEKDRENAIPPSMTDWTDVAYAWAMEGNGQRAEALLQTLHDASQAGRVNYEPDLSIYNMVLKAWSKSSDQLAASHALRILDWMEDQSYQSGKRHLQPNTQSYNAVLEACKQSDDPKLHDALLNILQQMEDHYEAGIVSAKPNRTSFFLVFTALARLRTPGSHLATLSFLQRMERLHEENTYGRLLDKDYYTMAIGACAWASDRSGAAEAEKLLDKMEEGKSFNFKIKLFTYDDVLGGWARSLSDDALERSRKILKRMPLKKSKYSYNYILAAALCSPHESALEIAQDAILRLQDIYLSGLASFYPHAGALIRLFGKEIKNIKFSLETLCQMVDSLEEYHDGNEDRGLFLNECYKYALQVCCFSRDKDAVNKANQLWKQMNAKSIPTSPQALELLLQVHDEHDSHPSEIEKLVIVAEDNYNTGKSDWHPDADMYNLVIRKWSQLRKPEAVQKSYDMLMHMDQISKDKGPDSCVKPEVVSYTNVLWACAVTPTTDVREQLKNFAVAIDTFNHLRTSEHCETDHVIYNRLLMCGIVLGRGTKSHSKIITQVFQLCCRDGFVDERILQHFCKAVPPDILLNIFGVADKNSVTLSQIREDWKRNANK